MAWTASSSGVEQHFSKVERSHIERAGTGGDTERRAIIALQQKGDRKTDCRLLERARALYAQGKGFSRKRTGTRFDKGVTKGARKGAASEAAWVRQRRAEADKAVMATRFTTPSKQQRRTAHFDTPPMQAEQKRQRRLCRARRLEAQVDGLLLDDETVPEKAVLARERHLKALDQQRGQKVQHHLALANMALAQRPAASLWRGLAGTVAWVQRKLPEGQAHLGLQQALLNHGIHAITEELPSHTNSLCQIDRFMMHDMRCGVTRGMALWCDTQQSFFLNGMAFHEFAHDLIMCRTCERGHSLWSVEQRRRGRRSGWRC